MFRFQMIALFGMMLMTVAAQGFSYAYWLRDNNGPVLSPETDVKVEWLTADEYRRRSEPGNSRSPN